MDYFNEFKMIGLGDDTNSLNKKDSFKAIRKSNNKDFTLKEIEKINANNRLYQNNELNQEELMKRESEQTG